MYLTVLVDGKSVRQEAVPAFGANYDLIVAGLGTGGAAAAVAASGRGLQVLGVERLTLAGGSATAGGVFGYYYGQPGGRFEETDRKARELQERMFVAAGSFHPDAKAIALEQELTAAGADLLWESGVAGVWRETDGTITGVRVATPEGVKDFGCKYLIDATGDGAVAAMAGAAFTIGREFDGEGQPYSSVRVFLEKKKNNKLGMANFDAGYVNADDPRDLTRAVIGGGAKHFAWAGDTDNQLLWVAQLVGVREGRLIEGDVRLTLDGFLSGQSAGEPVFYAYSNFDSHSQDWALEGGTIKDWMVASSLWGKNLYFPVPLEAMLAKGFPNLLVTGRCLSVDHDMACAIRMQRCLQKGGEALGEAVALAVAAQVPVRQIDRRKLSAILRESGCLNDELPAEAVWTEDSLRQVLDSEKPGEAIWFAGSHPELFRTQLRQWLTGGSAMLSSNSALALGIGGDSAALQVLRRIVDERDSFIPASSRSHNQARLLGAIHLLGKLLDSDSIDRLIALLRERNGDFQIFSHVMIALLCLGDKFAGRRQDIAAVLAEFLNRPDFELKMILKNSSHTADVIAESMTNLLRLAAGRRFDAWKIAHDLASLSRCAKLTLRERRLLAGTTCPDRQDGRISA